MRELGLAQFAKDNKGTDGYYTVLYAAIVKAIAAREVAAQTVFGESEPQDDGDNLAEQAMMEALKGVGLGEEE